jgi:hypothetical protein
MASQLSINLAFVSNVGIYPSRSNLDLQEGGRDHSRSPITSALLNFEAPVPSGNKGSALLIRVIAAAVFLVVN